MALKKSELYSSLWSSCDALRGGMDATQYKDYVLSLLFIKYVSDKYVGQPFAPVTVPEGSSFRDLAELKGKPDIGDQINKKIVAPLAAANQQLSQSDFPDFNDPVKLGDGQANRMQEQQLMLFAYRTSCHDFAANQFRLLLSSFAYVLLRSLRERLLTGTEVATAQVSTIRLSLLKIATRVTVSVRRVVLHLCSHCPHQSRFRQLAEALIPSPG